MWGVEDTIFEFTQFEPIWGVVDPAYEGFQNISTMRAPSFYMLGCQLFTGSNTTRPLESLHSSSSS